VTRPLAEIAAAEYVATALVPLLERHRQTIELLRQRSRLEQGVAFTDLIPARVATVNKFIVYYLHPDARYAVTLLETKERFKISVGSNPWPKVPRTHDIAKLCERYGGGGHPAVGAISLPKTDPAAVEQVAADIVAFLQTG
jgi:nanoRNase/pAp phosphatase (c-di-AMP/oligoRNAs hydrolase)